MTTSEDDSPPDAARVVVVHRVSCWLPQTETWLYEQVRHLPPSFQSHIACDSTMNLDQFHLPNIHDLKTRGRNQSLLVRTASRLNVPLPPRSLHRLARQTRARILHSHFGPVGWYAMPVARRAKLKHLVTFYGYDVESLPRTSARWPKRYRDMFRSVDLVLCEGPYMASRIRALGCPPDKLRVHHLGVRVEQIAFRPRSWDRSTPLRVLIAASFRQKKGIPYAMEALGILSRSMRIDVTVIGDAAPDVEGQAEKVRIMEVVTRHQGQLVVRFLGYVPHETMLAEAYQHHVFLSPSVTASSGDTEGGAPVSLIDMMATGTLIVSTRHCDIPNVIVDGVSGLLADERDVEGIVRHLTWLANNLCRWQEIATAARRRAEDDFNARVQGQRLAALYRSVLQDQ